MTLDKQKIKKETFSFFKDLFIIIIIVLVIRAFFIAPFQIKGHSMDSNFYDKEFILVNRFTTINFPFIGKIDPYKRGDVVVFEPRDRKGGLIEHNGLVNEEDGLISHFRRFIAWPKTTYIKRIIGLPGDTIRIENGEVYLKEKGKKDFVKLEEKFLNSENKGKTYIGRYDDKSRHDFVVPEGKIFVMGDNRLHSGDSRVCFSECIGDYTEFVDKKYIIGKVWFDLGYFNFSNFFDNPESKTKTYPRFLNFPKTYNYNLK